MIYDNLIIENKLEIPGRGIILVCDLKNNGLVKNDLMHECPIKEDDYIKYKNKHYQVTGIELARVAMDFHENIKSTIGIIVKEAAYIKGEERRGMRFEYLDGSTETIWFR